MAVTTSLLTNDIITRDALMVLHEKLTFISTINKQYDSSFAQTGAKIGQTLRIRLPYDPQVTDGATMSAAAMTARNASLTVSTRKHVGMDFTLQDRTMKIDDFRAMFIEPAMSNLAAAVEADVIRGLTRKVFNVVGTPGTTPNSLDTPLAARKTLNQFLAPKGDRSIMLTSAASASMVSALKGLFQDQSAIKQQYAEGMMGRTSGFDWYENESVYAHTRGTATNGTVTTTIASNGSNTISLSGLGASATVVPGDVFTIANVKMVHPQTKALKQDLMQFTVVQGGTANGSGVLAGVVVSPAFYYSAGEYQNINSAPQGAAVVTWSGAASSVLDQSLAYHKNAFTFATADLEMPRGLPAGACSRQNFEGISLRMVEGYNITDDQSPIRIDILYGYEALRPEHAVRITS